jgi:hypothetical protein
MTEVWVGECQRRLSTGILHDVSEDLTANIRALKEQGFALCTVFVWLRVR